MGFQDFMPGISKRNEGLYKRGTGFSNPGPRFLHPVTGSSKLA
jgi:hypothetical protein